MAISEEERRAKNAEKQRRYRERQRAAKAAAAAAEGNAASVPAPTRMRDAVEATLKASKWVAGSDAATIEQARLLAEQVDVLTHARSTERALSAHRALTAVLRDLGAAPVVRMQNELRSRRVEGAEEEADRVDDGKSPANVSAFERPAKRRRA